MKRSSSSGLTSGLQRVGTPAPVVVTFEDDEVVDSFGDLAYFAGDGGEQTLLALLQSLLVGQDESFTVLHTMELSPGKYADIHVVPEDSLRHMVLLDATDASLEARGLQQTRNEAELAGRRLKQKLAAELEERRSELDRHREREQSLQRSRELLDLLHDDARVRLHATVGHARILARYCADDPVAMRSVACIQRMAVYLEAQLLNYVEHVHEGGTGGPATTEPIAIEYLAAELRRLFSVDREHSLEIQAPPSVAGRGTMVELDYPRVYQLLITLIALAFEGEGRRDVRLRLNVRDRTPGAGQGRALLVDVDARADWGKGAAPGREIPLHAMQGADASVQFGLHACDRLVQSMGGEFKFEAAEEGRVRARIRIPLPHQASDRGVLPKASAGKCAVIAVDDPELAERVVSLMPEVGLDPLVVDALHQLEAAAGADDTGLLVLSEAFSGESGAGLIYHLHQLGMQAPVVMLSYRRPPSAANGWLRERRRVVVAADAGRDVLLAALQDAAGQGRSYT